MRWSLSICAKRGLRPGACKTLQGVSTLPGHQQGLQKPADGLIEGLSWPLPCTNPTDQLRREPDLHAWRRGLFLVRLLDLVQEVQAPRHSLPGHVGSTRGQTRSTNLCRPHRAPRR